MFYLLPIFYRKVNLMLLKIPGKNGWTCSDFHGCAHQFFSLLLLCPRNEIGSSTVTSFCADLIWQLLDKILLTKTYRQKLSYVIIFFSKNLNILIPLFITTGSRFSLDDVLGDRFQPLAFNGSWLKNNQLLITDADDNLQILDAPSGTLQPLLFNESIVSLTYNIFQPKTIFNFNYPIPRRCKDLKLKVCTLFEILHVLTTACAAWIKIFFIAG